MSFFVEVKVVPNAGRQKCILDKSGQLKCYIKSLPEKGKANAELIKMFSSALKVPKSAISIQSGLISRKKRLKIEKDISFDQLLHSLGIYIKQLTI
jgi:uncharacterized protein